MNPFLRWSSYIFRSPSCTYFWFQLEPSPCTLCKSRSYASNPLFNFGNSHEDMRFACRDQITHSLDRFRTNARWPTMFWHTSSRNSHHHTHFVRRPTFTLNFRFFGRELNLNHHILIFLSQVPKFHLKIDLFHSWIPHYLSPYLWSFRQLVWSCLLGHIKSHSLDVVGTVLFYF